MNYDYHYAVTVEVMITLKIFYFSNVNGAPIILWVCALSLHFLPCATHFLSCTQNLAIQISFLLNFISKVLTPNC